jgi:hypothetical protein
MNLFREDSSRNLNKIFPPQRGGFELPQVLGGVVQLTHDYLGTLPYAACSIYDNIGGADVLSIVQAIGVPDGYIWIVDELHVQTDDTASRLLRLSLHYINSVGDFSIYVFNVASGTTGDNWPLGRRLIMPPGGKLELNTAALTAGKRLRYTMSYLQVPAGQFAPKT